MLKYKVRTLLVFCLSCFCFDLCFSRESLGATGPKIVFEQIQHDFGVIPGHSKKSHTFRFKNAGTSSLIVKRVHSTCGCTAAVLGKKVYAPSEAGQLKVTFSSGRRRGAFSKYINVYSNDPVNSQTTLKIVGEVKSDLSVTPQIIDFGQVMNLKDAHHQLAVRAQSDGLLESLGVDYTGGIDVELLPAQKDRERKLRVSLLPTVSAGRINEKITLRVSNRSPITVVVRGFIEGPFSVYPKTVFLSVFRDSEGSMLVNGQINSDMLPSKTVLLESKGDFPCQIEKVDYDTEFFSVDLHEEQSNQQKYRLTIALINIPKQNLNKKIRVHTNARDVSIVEIPVRVWVRTTTKLKNINQQE